MRTAPSSIQTYARLAGLGYLVIIVTGIFAEFFVRSSIIVPGDATATAANLLGAQDLFRSGLHRRGVLLSLASGKRRPDSGRGWGVLSVTQVPAA